MSDICRPVILIGDINKTVVFILKMKGYECWVQSERVMTLFATPDKSQPMLEIAFQIMDNDQIYFKVWRQGGFKKQNNRSYAPKQILQMIADIEKFSTKK